MPSGRFGSRLGIALQLFCINSAIKADLVHQTVIRGVSEGCWVPNWPFILFLEQWCTEYDLGFNLFIIQSADLSAFSNAGRKKVNDLLLALAILPRPTRTDFFWNYPTWIRPESDLNSFSSRHNAIINFVAIPYSKGHKPFMYAWL